MNNVNRSKGGILADSEEKKYIPVFLLFKLGSRKV